MARHLIAEGIVASISEESVRQRLRSHRLQPWRYRMWLSAKVPRDAAFRAAVERLGDLYARPLLAQERVICTDEITNLQPRPRRSPTLPARPEWPVRVEHESKRCGALNLLTAFDTRSGQVFGVTAERKRQIEFLQWLSLLDADPPGQRDGDLPGAGQCADAHGQGSPAMAGRASAFCVGASSGVLLLDEPGGAVVFHSAPQTSEGGGLHGQGRFGGAVAGVYPRME